MEKHFCDICDGQIAWSPLPTVQLEKEKVDMSDRPIQLELCRTCFLAIKSFVRTYAKSFSKDI